MLSKKKIAIYILIVSLISLQLIQLKLLSSVNNDIDSFEEINYMWIQITNELKQKLNINSVCKHPTLALSPKEVVENYYDWYIRETNHRSFVNYYLGGLIKGLIASGDYIKKEYLTDQFIHHIENTGYLSGDPILCSNDLARSISVGDMVIDGANAAVTLIREIGTNSEITIYLKQIDGHWKIDKTSCFNNYF